MKLKTTLPEMYKNTLKIKSSLTSTQVNSVLTMSSVHFTLSLMANHKGPSKFIQIKNSYITGLNSQKTDINSVPSSLQMGQIIYERNMGWVV